MHDGLMARTPSRAIPCGQDERRTRISERAGPAANVAGIPRGLCRPPMQIGCAADSSHTTMRETYPILGQRDSRVPSVMEHRIKRLHCGKRQRHLSSEQNPFPVAKGALRLLTHTAFVNVIGSACFISLSFCTSA